MRPQDQVGKVDAISAHSWKRARQNQRFSPKFNEGKRICRPKESVRRVAGTGCCHLNIDHDKVLSEHTLMGFSFYKTLIAFLFMGAGCLPAVAGKDANVNSKARGKTDIEKRILDLVEKQWKKEEPKSQPEQNMLWNFVVSPPLPATWPLNQSTVITVYAYSSGRHLEALGRYEDISKPWAKVEFMLAEPSNPRFTRLPSGIRDGLEKQGIRPLTAKEIEFSKTDLYVSLDLLSRTNKTPRHLDEQTLEVYCFWKKTNGVSAREILMHHPKLSIQLKCD